MQTRIIRLIPTLVLLAAAGCATSAPPTSVTTGILAPNCDGIPNPERNPACPEWTGERATTGPAAWARR